MNDFIQTLNDQTAVKLLSTIAKPHIDAGGNDTELTSELCDTLKNEFGSQEATESVSDGDMARHALQLLAQDQQMRERIRAMVEIPQLGKFVDPAVAIGLSAALVFVLKTSGMMKRDENGKLTWQVEWKSLDNKLLKGFVDKLLSWIPGGPFK